MLKVGMPEDYLGFFAQFRSIDRILTLRPKIAYVELLIILAKTPGEDHTISRQPYYHVASRKYLFISLHTKHGTGFKPFWLVPFITFHIFSLPSTSAPEVLQIDDDGV